MYDFLNLKALFSVFYHRTSLIDESYIPRTNFIINENNQNLLFEYPDIGGDKWINNFKLAFSEMLSIAGERSLQCSIIPPNVSHISTVRSITFSDEKYLIELASLCSSIIYDFYIKIIGRDHITYSDAERFPFGVNQKSYNLLSIRVMLLNALNKYYAPLWERHYHPNFRQDQWSKSDPRLKPFDQLGPEWEWGTPLRNWYERRWALVEIDVITAMALGLTLEELTLIYNVQFPVLQQNEDDTWYDTKGNIVFTCSKGLTGVGVDRPVWNTIKDMKAGETYVHTIEKSELYYGQEVTYYAPFDKCDRVADYGVAWAFFAERFGEGGI